MSLLSLWRRATRSNATRQAARDEQLLMSLFLLAWAVEARDPYTGGHLWRVARLSRLLAESAGLEPQQVARITIGAFLHDLGKIGIPDAVLGKKSRLDEAEYAVIKTHPEIGHRMLAGHPLAALAADAVLLHHETPDGRGYPFGRRGEEIPLAARIVGICDAFDAMTSTRPYRSGMPIARAMEIIGSELGRQFDATWGRLFIGLQQHAELAHIVGHSDEGIPMQRCLSCGPVVVRPRHAVAGDTLYCPACHSEYTLAPDDQGLIATGKQDTARALAVAPDSGLIGRLVGESLAALA
ncbi:HD-GYP domain-containing protein [Herbaspirillum camelliae]|uniref:HD-GYP domain-containing protein n=1 Tax=Herbaspirillum camelliae TaxID=1892903 RepID=UPI000A84BFED|nr:HD-GYP domain-containing protein [Herbaspirillum camelliae]